MSWLRHDNDKGYYYYIGGDQIEMIKNADSEAVLLLYFSP